jgi:hypothetical protein
MDMQALAERLGARKALGMTAEQYNAHLRQQKADAAAQRHRDIAAAIRAGMYGTDAEIDAALAKITRG